MNRLRTGQAPTRAQPQRNCPGPDSPNPKQHVTKVSAINAEAANATTWRLAARLDKWTALRTGWGFYALLALLALTAIPYGTVAPWWETLFECGIFALASGWVYRMTQRAQPGPWLAGGTLLAPWLALLVFAVLQTLPVWPSARGPLGYVLSASPFETWRFILKVLALVLAGMLLRAGIEGKAQRFRALVHFVIGVGVASACFALWRKSAQTPGSAFVLPGLQAGIGFGQFINHNHFAFLMEMTWGLLCGLVIGAHRQSRRFWFYASAGVIVWLALVLSNSRGGVYSMLGQLCCLAVLWPRLRSAQVGQAAAAAASLPTVPETQRLPAAPGLPRASWVRRLALGACLLAVSVIGVSWIGGDSLANRFDQLPRELSVDTALNPRLQVRRIEMWQAAWQLIQTQPLAGSGLGAFEAAVTEYYDASGNWTLRQAHNDYLELLAGGGVVGALLLGWFVIVLLWQARRQLQVPDPFRRAVCVGALVGLSGVAMHSLVDFGLHLPVNALIGAALVVLATTPRVHEFSAAAQDAQPSTIPSLPQPATAADCLAAPAKSPALAQPTRETSGKRRAVQPSRKEPK